MSIHPNSTNSPAIEILKYEKKKDKKKQEEENKGLSCHTFQTRNTINC